MAYQAANSNPVDGHDVPVPHFGSAGWDDWYPGGATEAKGNLLVIEPIRFAGQPGEQATLFLSTRQRTGV
jgi:extradiol dioxygenase family protein